MRKNWEKSEEMFLQENHGKPIIDLAYQLKRTVDSVSRKLQILGLVNREKKWTIEEDKVIIDFYQSLSDEEISNKINRSIVAIGHRAVFLGIKKNPLPKVGDKFHFLEVIEESFYGEPDNIGKRHSLVKCKCKCGNIKIFDLSNIKKGVTKSCGCYKSECSRERIISLSYKHGKSHTHNRLYNIWVGMKSRCYDINQEVYKNYGGRGIYVCNEWKNDFLVFEKWANENGYDDSLSLERKNNNGNYCPENCKWATGIEQCRNRRDNKMIIAFGETKCLAAWIEDPRCIIKKYGTILQRIIRGMNGQEALTTPLSKPGPKRKA